MMIHNTTGVLAEQEIGDVDRQVLVPDVNEVPPHQNPDHPTEPMKWRATTSNKEEGCHAEMPRHRDTSTSQKIRDLDARLDAINTGAGAPVTVDALIKQTEPPFTRRILRVKVSFSFKLPT